MISTGERMEALYCLVGIKSLAHKFFSVFFFLLEYTRYSEEAMATHSSTLAWKIPWMEEPGGLQSWGR